MFWQDFSGRGRMVSPWRELERLQREVNRVFSETREPGDVAFPSVNLWTNQEGAVLSAELPGVDADKLDISVLGNSVTIHGTREPLDIGQDATYHRRERLCGEFTRTLEVPFRIEAGKVAAEYNRGILNVMLPRADEDRPRQITVKAS